MWKLLRNTLLAAVLLAGALKLLVWYEVRQDGTRVVALIAPRADIHYSSIGAGLNGSVDLSNVVLSIPDGHARNVFRADQIRLETPGVFWLLQHALFRENTLPPHLVMHIQGLQSQTFSALPIFDAAWINPISMVPFETMGCGVVSRFSVADYQRMGLNPAAAQQQLEYKYDSLAHTLDFSATLETPPFSTIKLHGELQRFDPATFNAADASRHLHFGQLGLDYADDNYLAKRNRFCAQMSNVAPAQFVDQHIAATTAFLAERGIAPSGDLLKLYRSLVDGGGHLSLLSLPNAGVDSAQLLSETPDEMLRQMNITTRHDDAPPVMFRLSFNIPSNEVPADAAAVIPASPPTNGTSAAVVTETIPTMVVVPPPPPMAVTKPPAHETAAAKVKREASSQLLARTSLDAVSTPAPHTDPATRANVAGLDRSRAGVGLPGSAPAAPVAATIAPEYFPSSPQPPADSTLALVWKPTIERLPERHAAAREHPLIEYASLGTYVGQRVRVVTTSGNTVEGRILGVDNLGVHLSLSNHGGTAELQMPRSAIGQIQLLSVRASASTE